LDNNEFSYLPLISGSNLRYLSCSNNYLTSLNLSFTGRNIYYADFSNNQISSYTPPAYSATPYYIVGNNNLLPTSMTDLILSNATYYETPSNGIMILNGTGNEGPSDTGWEYVLTLKGKGWTLTLNDTWSSSSSSSIDSHSSPSSSSSSSSPG
jgi:hypothetical protein